jgi:hypothetical protein
VKEYIPKHIFRRELEAFDVNVGGLRRFYKSDHAAQMIFDIFAARQNDSRMTTISSLVSILTGASFVISRPEVARVFEALQTFNCGDYVKGKRIGNANAQSRFVWKVSLVSIGRAATDKKNR